MRQWTWPGLLYGGRTAVRRDVAVTVTPTALRIEADGMEPLWWPYRDLRQGATFQRDEPVRLEHGGEGEAVVVADDAFMAAIRSVAPTTAPHLADAAARRRRIQLVTAGALAALGAIAAIYLWGIPALADHFARDVPVAWEEQLGRATLLRMTADRKVCANPAVADALSRIVGRLAAAAPGNPYRFTVTVVDDDAINAFAAPGGPIVVNRGLLRRTRTPEELAGVLGHEMQHVLLRHGTRLILRDIPTRLILASISGDLRGLGGAAQAAGALGIARYQRKDEAAADSAGLDLLVRAGVNPAGMVSFFKTLQHEAGDEPAALSYLSDHPRTAQRVADMSRRAAAVPPGALRPLLPGVRWAAVAAGCR